MTDRTPNRAEEIAFTLEELVKDKNLDVLGAVIDRDNGAIRMFHTVDDWITCAGVASYINTKIAGLALIEDMTNTLEECVEQVKTEKKDV